MTTIKINNKIVDGNKYIEKKEIIEINKDNCEIDCGSDCKIDCLSDCEIDCWNNCKIYCLSDCEIDCWNNCKIYCLSDCKIDCLSDCKIDCRNNCKMNAGKGTEVKGYYEGKYYYYEFTERKTIIFKDGKFEEVKE